MGEKEKSWLQLHFSLTLERVQQTRVVEPLVVVILLLQDRGAESLVVHRFCLSLSLSPERENLISSKQITK